MNSKQWMIRLVLTTIVVVGIPAFGVMGFNYWIDPLWNFEHKNDYNDYQVGFDERQQKTNYINSRKFDYDSLLIGTSRVTYMDSREFKGEKVFNYSLSSLHIDEYLPFIQYAAKKKGEDFDTIYMELYQNSYNAGEVTNTGRAASIYIDIAENPFYKFTSLFSEKTLESAITNYEISKENKYDGPRSYTRDNVAQTSFSNERLPIILDKFEESFNKRANQPVAYNENYKKRLIDLKNAFPNTKFVVFTDPMPEERLNTILSSPYHRDAYNRWYKEMVDVFGEVYSFQGSTPVTTNMDYFFDAFHYYPVVGDMMMQAMQHPKEHTDILHIVNKNNLTTYLQEVGQE
ncbi:hypothetical protein [Bacillus massiliigorillae]|uniref:hypothetical protein n=1 Tax=Bacillus massiliigorillae TaxID=1243664 RepID=UPI0003A28396|nr:hypothetical protein [Bacillus massiliigorillae]